MYKILREREAEEELPDRSEEFVDGRGVRRRICRSSCRVGRTRRSGNMYAGRVISGDVKNVHTVRTGIEYMTWLAEWYTKNAKKLRNRRRLDRLLPDRRRHRGRFSDLRRADAAPGSCSAPACRCGAISPRSAIRRRATAAIPARCRTRKSPGASSARRRRNSSSKAMRRLCAPLIFAWVLGQ